MAKVLVATEKPFASAAIKLIKEVTDSAGYELVLLEKYTEKQQLLDAVSDVDAVIIRSDIVDSEVINAGKNLKIVVRAGAGYDNVDLAAATSKDVCVMNTPGQNSNAVAELALGMMVFLARNQYNGSAGTELMGKKLGIHAYGNVGKNVARIAKGFGMEVYAYDPYCEDKIKADGINLITDLKTFYSTCDYVSLNIPATADTKKSINYDLLRFMPKGGVLVNTARKEVIDEDGLLKIMEDRQDFKYISDIAPDCTSVFAEKYSGRYFFTPKKMGAQTAEANINAGVAAAKQIVGFLDNGDATFKVNK
ncbi:3-phosphoglycerate dehydrogenase [Saccharicrinis sp. FJH62]|uniref:3-phosphoglycerate dehydrogenase n=1 Tax=Saccharicrinis sp. FJH62 TaxID=3344657 RepID=UPI0035D40D8A